MNVLLLKTAVDERADVALGREARWLRELADAPPLDAHVPRLLEEGFGCCGRRYLVLSMPAGGGAAPQFTREHARFLAQLGKARFRAGDFELSGCSRRLRRALADLRQYAAEGEASPLEEAYRECETSLLYWTGPYVLSQGEFAPWNVRALGSRLFVCDWSGARTGANPLEDVLHYLVANAARSGRIDGARPLQAAMQRAQQFAREAYPRWSWRPSVVGALTLLYLIGAWLRRASAMRRIDRNDVLLATYWKLIEARSAWMPA